MNTLDLYFIFRKCIKVKLPFCLFFLVIFFSEARANVAPPGIWGAGHASTLIPIFREDSFAISQLQMEKELIEIDLYRNFAVVKGTYCFKNHSRKFLKLKMGYPINGSHPATPIEEIRFDDLYHLRVLINGQSKEIKLLSELIEKLESEDMKKDLIPNSLEKCEDWYVWEMESLPEGVVQVQVYFIVKTNATLIQGYGRKEGNAFEYILHTGATWKNRILSGSIEIQLKDRLKVGDIFGVNPPAAIKWSGNWLFYSFSNLEPERSDDLILWYNGAPEEFESNFPSDSLFQSLDERVALKHINSEFQYLNQINYETPIPEFKYIIIGVIVLFISLIISVIWLIVWFFRRIKN